MFQWMKREAARMGLLLRSVPAGMTALLTVSVITMNLLANKSVSLPVDWLALDGGVLVSWMTFLAMDILTKHFGPKAATEMSVFAAAMNLLACLFFYLASRIPGQWGMAFETADPATANAALDGTFAGTWYVLLGSTVAFLLSAGVNNFLNYAIGRSIRKNPDGFGAYAARTYISTAVGQFVDNMTFALIVSHVFFGWTMVQCVTCAATGMVVELLCEVVFSRLGYSVCRRWKREGVGRAYLDSLEGDSL